jgi:protein-tyrosine phosphatase
MALQANAQQQKISVLVVCTGNICRSPLAEQLLRREAVLAGLDQQMSFDSAGTYAEIGSLTHSQTIESAALRGVSIEPTASKQLTSQMIEDADLVLTATAEHRLYAIEQVPSANRKTYTLKEFARIAGFFAGDLSHLDPMIQKAISEADGHSGRLSAIAKYRGYAPKPEAGEDILDPYGRNPDVFTVVTDELLELSRVIISAFND